MQYQGVCNTYLYFVSTNTHALMNKTLKPLHTEFISMYPIYNYISEYSYTI